MDKPGTGGPVMDPPGGVVTERERPDWNMDLEDNRDTLNIAERRPSQPVLEVSPVYKSLGWSDPKHLNIERPAVLRSGKGAANCTSPLLNSPGSTGLPLPSPIITKRTRTNSTYDRAMDNPIEKGNIKYFSRGKGHGFIVSERGGDDVFVHISDIEGEYVPREGDEVTFRLCPIPPKLEKFQAIHVRIVNFTPDVHLKWDSPLDEEEKCCEYIQTFVVD